MLLEPIIGTDTPSDMDAFEPQALGAIRFDASPFPRATWL